MRIFFDAGQTIYDDDISNMQKEPYPVKPASLATLRLYASMIAFLSILVLPLLGGCSSGGGGDTSTGPSESLTVTLSASTVTVPAGGSIGRTTATIARTGTTGSVTLTVSGLPSGAVVSYTQPGSGNSGTIALNPETAAQGTYSLTVTASDGTSTATAPLTYIINAGTASALATPIAWSSTAALISAIPNATHPIISVKDPTVVYDNNKWNVYATTADSSSNWSMVNLQFDNWSDAASAQPYYMDATSGFSGYHCAPELFYFTPQKKWYLIFQSGQPQYSTTSDPTQPSTWSTPTNFFASQPASVSAWIDFWVICDTNNCYLFFAGDNGIIYRSQTTIGSFPAGFSEPVAILQDTNNIYNLFESDKVFLLKGLNQYLMMVEGIGPTGHRFFRAFVAPSLDGSFTPVANASTWAAPFAGENNVSFASGVTAWTDDISHGELIRDGYDETMEIDPANLQFLYQGVIPADASVAYPLIPYQLGLLKRSN